MLETTESVTNNSMSALETLLNRYPGGWLGIRPPLGAFGHYQHDDVDFSRFQKSFSVIDYADLALEIAVAASGVIPLYCEGLQDIGLYIDKYDAPEGMPRISIRDEECMGGGLPLHDFTYADACSYLDSLYSTDEEKSPKDINDEWQKTMSGGYVLNSFLEIGLGHDLQHCYFDNSVTFLQHERSPGWQRRLFHHAFNQLIAENEIIQHDNYPLTQNERSFFSYLKWYQSHKQTN